MAVAAGVIGIALAGGGNSAVAFSAASLVVWSVVLVGIAVGVFPRAEPPFGAIVTGACLAGLTALIAISIAWASDAGTAFEDVVRASGYLGLFVLVVVAAKRGEPRPWLWGLAIGLVAVSVLALGSRLEPSLFGEGDREIAETLPPAEGRLSYPIGYWNGLAATMGLAAVLLAWLGARADSRLSRALAVGALPLPVLTIFLATSRGGFAVAGIGLFVLVLAGPLRLRLLGSIALGLLGSLALIALAAARDELVDHPRTPLAETQGTELLGLTIVVVALVAIARWGLDRPLARERDPRWLLRVVVGAPLVAVALLLVFADPAERWEEFKEPPSRDPNAPQGQLDLTQGASNGRYQFWSTAVDAFAEHPVSGIGSADYEPYWNQNGPIRFATRSAHSLFLESLAELGIAGGALSIGFFAAAGYTGLRRLGLLGGPGGGEIGAALGMLAAGGAAAAVEWTWNLPAVFGGVVVAAALLTGPATLPFLAPRMEPPMAFMRSRRRFFVGVAVLLVAWAAICASGLLLLAERSLDHGRSAFARGDFTDAIAEANEAMDLEPWAAEPHTFLAQVYGRINDIPAAQAEIAEAIERSAEDWRVWVIAAQLDIAANDVAGARVNYEVANRLLPRYNGGDSVLYERLLK